MSFAFKHTIIPISPPSFGWSSLFDVLPKVVGRLEIHNSAIGCQLFAQGQHAEHEVGVLASVKEHNGPFCGSRFSVVQSCICLNASYMLFSSMFCLCLVYIQTIPYDRKTYRSWADQKWDETLQRPAVPSVVPQKGLEDPRSYIIKRVNI